MAAAEWRMADFMFEALIMAARRRCSAEMD